MTQVEYVDTSNQSITHEMGDDSWRGRLPLLYDPAEDTVYVGSADSAHTEVAGRKSLDPWSDEIFHGWVGFNPEADAELGRNVHGGFNYGWYDDMPPAHVDQAVQEHFGFQGEPQQDMSGWKFGSKAPRIEEVEAGEPADYDRHQELDWMPSRRPFVYDTEAKVVRVGPWGSFHSQIEGGGDEDDWEQYGTGAIFNDDWREGAHIKSFGNIDQEVLQALSDHYGLPLTPPRETSAWKWAANARPVILEGKKNQVDSPFFGWFDRGRTRPVVYDPHKGHIMIGQWGTHHYDVMEEFGYTNPDLDPTMYSSDALGESHMPEVHYATIQPRASDPKSFGLSTWGNFKAEHPEVEQALEEAGHIHNIDDTPADDGWKFGAVQTFSATKLDPIADFEHLGLTPDHEEAWKAVNEGWKPGKRGKGLVVDGKVYTWNIKLNDVGVTVPNHSTVAEMMGKAGHPEPGEYFYINEQGQYKDSFGTHRDVIEKADPRLTRKTDEGWKFTRVADFWDDERRKDFPEDFEEIGDPRGYSAQDIQKLIRQPIRPGQQGKAIEDNGVILAEWVVDAHGGPHHSEVAQALNLRRNDFDFIMIDRDGSRTNTADFADDWNF